MTHPNDVQTAAALRDVFVSPNEADRNLEPANVVDGLYAIARGLHAVATSLDRIGVAVRLDGLRRDDA